MTALAVRPLHLLLYLAVMTIWGVNFAVAKVGLEQLPPILLVTLRFALVAAMLAPFVRPPSGRWGQVFLISVTLGLLHFALMFTGLREIDASTAAIAIQLQVPFAALLAAVLFDDRLGWRRALGMVIAFGGVAIIAGAPRVAGKYAALAMVLSAACVWAIANIQIKRLGKIDGMTLNAWIAVFATPQLAIASWLLEDGQLDALSRLDWTLVMVVVYQAVLVVVVGYGTWYWLLHRHDVNQAMPFTLLVPLIGVLSGVVFLDEPLTSGLLIGGALTVAGVAVIVLRRPRLTAPEAERV